MAEEIADRIYRGSLSVIVHRFMKRCSVAVKELMWERLQTEPQGIVEENGLCSPGRLKEVMPDGTLYGISAHNDEPGGAHPVKTRLKED